jgi:hypothetical protein
MRNKGQMFIIAAIIMIVILIILKTGVNIPDIMQRNRELEGNFEHDFFVNTVNELKKTIDISYHQPSNITNNVFNFGNFTRKKMTERLQNFDFFYADVIIPASQGSETMNVTVVNLLNKNTSITLNLNGIIKRPTPSIITTSVDTNYIVGDYSSIAIDSKDYVHISYYKDTSMDLRYCNNTLGTWTCTDVDTAGNFGFFSSIAIDSKDYVHISHAKRTLSPTDFDLRYCNNTLGTWTCTNVEIGGSIGLSSSIAIDSNDKVHISHHNSTSDDLRYCNNTLGTWTCTNVWTTNQVGYNPSIAIDSNDKVHISHYNITGDSLSYCNNTLGTWTCITVSAGGDVGETSSIAIDSNDKVHISCRNFTGKGLHYCNNTAGTWTCTDIETGGNAGLYTSIAIDSNNKVHMSHYNDTDNTFRYCYTDDFSTWNCQKIDDTGDEGVVTYGRAIAIKKGVLATTTSFSSNVHISYYNATTADLMYAKISFNVEDSNRWDTNFTITQGNYYTLTVDYNDNQENITIGTKVNKSVYVGFFDITLTGSETTYKDKFQKSYTLP